MKRLSTHVPNQMPGKVWKPVFFIAFLLLFFFIYHHWNGMLVTIIEWQKLLHTMLASHIQAVADNAFEHGAALIALSFAYGVFHAVGPGHGKSVIVTYLATQKESLPKGVLISMLAAILQAGVAITLVTLSAQMLTFKLSDAHNYGNDIALVSYVLVIILGVMLLASALPAVLNLQRIKTNHQHHPDHTDAKHSLDREHPAGDCCGGSHVHTPEKNQTLWKTITVIFSMGLRPCSGALVVLIYAHLVGVFYYGVMATLLMGLGTGLSIGAIAACTYYARSWIEKRAEQKAVPLPFGIASLGPYIRLTGGVILVILGWSLYSVATIISSDHPLF